MIVFCLDTDLDRSQNAEVEIAVGEAVETVRIPQLGTRRKSEETPNPRRYLPHLRHVGAEAQRGRRVLLLQAADATCNAELLEALRSLTGAYPLLVQTSGQRRELGIPGPLRVLDVEAYLLESERSVLSPWETRGFELLPPELRPH